MTKFKVTHNAINNVNKEEVFVAAGYIIKDSWIHFTEGSDRQAIASLRESDVLRIDRTDE